MTLEDTREVGEVGHHFQSTGGLILLDDVVVGAAPDVVRVGSALELVAAAGCLL